MSVVVSRRAAVVGAVAALAVVVTLVVILTGVFAGGPGAAPAAALVRPVAEKDVVGKLRTFTERDFPTSCGVRAATVRKYAPGGHAQHGRLECHWTSADPERELTVKVTPAEHAVASAGESAAGVALRSFEPSRMSVALGRPPRPVTGLGDEAAFTYSAAQRNLDGEGATLRFRVGAAVAWINYRGRDEGPKDVFTEVPDAEARRAVFAAATDLAKRIGVGAAPAFGTPRRAAGPPPARRVPYPCDLVPASLAARLAPDAERRRPFEGTGRPVVDDLGEDVCTWASPAIARPGTGEVRRPARNLTVTVRRAGAWLARRDFLASYHDAREGAGRSRFQRVRGLGDEAYAVLHNAQLPAGNPQGAGANVAFRYRDIVVQVEYTGDSAELGEPRPPGDAVAAAYTVAVRARAALPA